MTKRQTPPGRRSKLIVVVVKPFGPHHCAKCLESVHAEKTRSRGASNSRIPMIDRGSLSRSRLFLAATSVRFMFTLLLTVLVAVFGFRFLGLQRLQINVEAVEALVEKAGIAVEPVVDVLERLRLHPAGPPLGLAWARDQAGALPHLQMPGD